MNLNFDTTSALAPIYIVSTAAFMDHNGNPAEVYRGPNYAMARMKVSFWDERADTWLEVRRPPRDALGRAMVRFDALLELLTAI